MENLVASDQQAAVQKLRVSEPLAKPSHDDTVMLLHCCTNLQVFLISYFRRVLYVVFSSG
jgi:hypothetical protein